MKNMLIMMHVTKESFVNEHGVRDDAWAVHARRYDCFGNVEHGDAAYMDTREDAIEILEKAL